MKIYMKVQGIQGPLTYDDKPGWFEVRSINLGENAAGGPPSKGGGQGREAEAPRFSNLIVIKDHDAVSTDLMRLYSNGLARDVTIVMLKPGRGGGPEEATRIQLVAAVVADFRTGSSEGVQLDTFTFNFQSITFEKGGAAQAKRMARPADWGSLEATAVFQRSAG